MESNQLKYVLEPISLYQILLIDCITSITAMTAMSDNRPPIYGVWWYSNSTIYASIKISTSIKEKQFKVNISRGDSQSVHSFTINNYNTNTIGTVANIVIPYTDQQPPYYVMVEMGGYDVLLAKIAAPSYNTRLSMGFTEGDLADIIKSIYVTTAKNVINQIDGMLANV